MPLTKVTSSLINTVSASQIVASGASAGQVLTYNGSTSTWVASAAPGNASSAYIAKAWVSFDGTRDSSGATNNNATNRYIYGSYNITSVQNTSTSGIYIVTFSAPMTDTNYVIAGTSSPNAANTYSASIQTFANASGYAAPTTNSFYMYTYNSAAPGSYVISVRVNLIIFGV